MAENIYSKGTRVWFANKEQGWISAEVTNVVRGADDKIKLSFQDQRGKVRIPSSGIIDVMLPYHCSHSPPGHQYRHDR